MIITWLSCDSSQTSVMELHSGTMHGVLALISLSPLTHTSTEVA